MIYFPDTNFFLHFKDAAECPWNDVTDDEQVRLVVCRTVQWEIDRKKHELKNRPQKRARKYASLFGKVVNTDQPAVLKKSKPTVTLELVLNWPSGWEAPSDLDVEKWPDDRLVADVLAFQAAEPEQQCALLTADSGVFATAKKHGVVVVPLYDKGWELPAETDSKDKKIAALEREVAELDRTEPAIEITILENENQLDEVTIEVVRFLPLSEPQLVRLTNKLKSAHPMATDFSNPPSKPQVTKAIGYLGGFDYSRLEQPYEWKAPTDEQVTAYSSEYERWLNDAQQLIASVPKKLQDSVFEKAFTISLSNIGAEPADQLRVTFQATPGVTGRAIRTFRDCTALT